MERQIDQVFFWSAFPFLFLRALWKVAWMLPLDLKIRNGVGKWILRQLLYRYVPRELVERPKWGFGLPIHSWLRGPLKDWAEAQLDRKRLEDEGFFGVEPVRQLWAEHQSSKHNWQHQLWDILMFQSWLDEWGHKRLGFIHTLYKKDGVWVREVSDNDGGHTTPYLAAM